MRERERVEGGGGGGGRREFELMYYFSCYNLLFEIVVPFLG